MFLEKFRPVDIRGRDFRFFYPVVESFVYDVLRCGTILRNLNLVG